MELRNIRLHLANVAKHPTEKTLEVIGTNVIRKKTEDGNFSKEVESYTILCAVRKNDTLKIKVPASMASLVTTLQDHLRNEIRPYVSFTGLKLTAYAMNANGTLYSGISGKADSFTITNTVQEPDLDEALFTIEE